MSGREGGGGLGRAPTLRALALVLAAALGAVGCFETRRSGGRADPSIDMPVTTGPLDEAGGPPRPGPDNTGVPAGTRLRSSGSLRLETPGEVVDGLDVDGCVEIIAADVVIRRTRIRCGEYYPIRIYEEEGASLVIEDSEIVGTSGLAQAGIAFSSYVARRVDISGTADGLKATEKVVVENSWIHDLWLGPGDHADGVQSTGGSGVVIRNNFIDIIDRGRGHGELPNAVFQVGKDGEGEPPVGNFVIEGNWLYGGGWVVNLDAGLPGNRVVDNRFGRGPALVHNQLPFPQYGPLNLLGVRSYILVQGNVWDDTGQQIEPG